MPKPISRILGAARPNRRSRSSGVGEKGTPYTGSSSLWARRWAFETRPWRKTKLRIWRRYSCKKYFVLRGLRRDQARSRRAGAGGVELLRHAAGEKGLAPGLDRFSHRLRHQHRVLRLRDRGVHEHRVAAELHRDGGIGGGAHAGIDHHRHLGAADDELE